MRAKEIAEHDLTTLFGAHLNFVSPTFGPINNHNICYLEINLKMLYTICILKNINNINIF